MSRFRNVLSVLTVIVSLLGGMAGQAEAQRRNERDIRDIVRSLNSRVDDFRYTLDFQLKSSSAGRRDSSAVMAGLQELQQKINAFQTNLDQNRENRDDVSEIIDSAKVVDQFLISNPQNRRITDDWNSVHKLIDRLAANYGTVPQWNSGVNSYPSVSTNPVSGIPVSASPLVGTFSLDRNRSESAEQIINEINVEQSRRQDLAEKLDAPEQLAISIRGSQVTLASSKSGPITFVADGQDKTETDAAGKSVRVRTTLRGQDLTVSSLGGATDYTVTFSPQDSGRSLKVTRRITTDYLNQTVFAESIYTRTDTVARLGINDAQAPISTDTDTGTYSDNTAQGGQYPSVPTAVPGRTGDYIVPNGVIITGLLDSTIDTGVSQNNDRFKMTVQSPNEFRGAVIEGYLTGVGRSGRVSGSSNVTFNFEKITLRSGQTYDFAGFLQSIKDQNGKVVRVDTEGTAKGDSQTRETAKRGGIGAGIGALIGVIAGGGKGAAIGAIIGGGAGAGSVIAQGREDVHLLPGSMITIQSSSPIRREQAVQDN